MTDVKTPTVPSMTGWKTKWGTIMLAVGTAVIGASDVAPKPEMVEWMKFSGTLMLGFGTALAAWGLGHKLEKNKPTIQNMYEQANQVPVTKAHIIKE